MLRPDGHDFSILLLLLLLLFPPPLFLFLHPVFLLAGEKVSGEEASGVFSNRCTTNMGVSHLPLLFLGQIYYMQHEVWHTGVYHPPGTRKYVLERLST